jgi:hypothetical protein
MFTNFARYLVLKRLDRRHQTARDPQTVPLPLPRVNVIDRELDPLGDLTVQNTRLSNDFMCDQLRRFLAYGPDQLSLEHPTLSPLAVAT